tara:strand:- start:26217 stop:26561 length:345 start_codon:yes stop_codon:yes gene_type:complete
MKFPTSDKIILRAAKRLAILEAGDKLGNDVWINNPKADALGDFFLTCSKSELIRIVELSRVCPDYAYEALDITYFNDAVTKADNGEGRFQDFYSEFNLEPSDLAQDPRQISLFN